MLIDVLFNDTNTTNKHIIEFDNLLYQIIGICEKHGSRLSEVECHALWIHTIKQIFGVKERVK